MNEFNGEHGTEEISNEQNFKIMKEFDLIYHTSESRYSQISNAALITDPTGVNDRTVEFIKKLRIEDGYTTSKSPFIKVKSDDLIYFLKLCMDADTIWSYYEITSTFAGVVYVVDVYRQLFLKNSIQFYKYNELDGEWIENDGVITFFMRFEYEKFAEIELKINGITLSIDYQTK